MPKRFHRRPHWRPTSTGRLRWRSTLANRLSIPLRYLKGKITAIRFVIALFAIPVVIYVYKEATRDILIVDLFTVPRQFQDSGLTAEVMANRIGDAISEIEQSASTHMKKDDMGLVQDEDLTPAVEIPGTKIGLKTAIDVARTIMGIYPKRISGDVVASDLAAGSSAREVRVTFYVTQGRKRSAPKSLAPLPANDVQGLIQRTAEAVLHQINPYVLAVHFTDEREYDRAIEICGEFSENVASLPKYKAAFDNLWGEVLRREGKNDEAIGKYEKAIELDRKLASPYNNWGIALQSKGKNDEAIGKYKKAIEVDRKLASPYINWGIALMNEGKNDEAIGKYEKAIELDPKRASPYINWGIALQNEGKDDEAIGKYEKAIEVDPKSALAYNDWGIALQNEGKDDEAEKLFQKAKQLGAS